VGQSFACNLGWHPLTLAHLSSITSNFENLVPKGRLNHLEYYCLDMNVTICIEEQWNAWGRVLLAN
jgi:hypothetical protein